MRIDSFQLFLEGCQISENLTFRSILPVEMLPKINFSVNVTGQ